MDEIVKRISRQSAACMLPKCLFVGRQEYQAIKKICADSLAFAVEEPIADVGDINRFMGLALYRVETDSILRVTP